MVINNIVGSDKFTVYQITNLLNKKRYIGVHKTKNINDSYMGSGKLIKRSIAKNGLEHFNKEILFIFDNYEDAFKKEVDLIRTTIPEYNLHEGGMGGWHYVNSKGRNFSSNKWDSEFRKQVSNVQLKKRILNYENNPKKCKYCQNTFSYENRKKIFCSETCKKKTYNPWNKGLSINESIKEKISNSLSKKYMHVRIYYVCKNCKNESFNTGRKREFCSMECKISYGKKRYNIDLILELYVKEKRSLRYISQKTGLNRYKLSKIIKENNIKLRYAK